MSRRTNPSAKGAPDVQRRGQKPSVPLAAMSDRCPECGRPLGYLMQQHHDKPGLIDSLRGAGGEGWRMFVTFAVCLLVVLLITGLFQMLSVAPG